MKETYNLFYVSTFCYYLRFASVGAVKVLPFLDDGYLVPHFLTPEKLLDAVIHQVDDVSSIFMVETQKDVFH